MGTTYNTSRIPLSGKAANSLPDERLLRTALGIVILLAVALGGRLLYVQIFNRAYYLRVDRAIHRPGPPAQSQAGAILDRRGRVLADSVMTASLRVNPRLLRDYEDTPSVAAYLADKLEVAPAEILEKLNRDSDFAYLQRRVPLSIARQIMAQHYRGISRDLEYKRVYPAGAVGCHLVGYCGSDHRPWAGIEYRYRFVLEGLPGLPQRNIDAWGRTIVGQENDGGLPPVPGKDVVLTVDLELQRVVDDALDRCWKYNKPTEATAVVMNPNTGAILALASRPNYDPNKIASAATGVEKVAISSKSLRNFCVNREYEPGSTFKVLLAAAALELGVVKPTDRFYCAGVTMLGGRPLHCWGRWGHRGHGHGSLDLSGVIAKSCNIGAAQIAVKIGPERFYKFLQDCGIGEPTAIGLPAEAAGRLQSPQTMRIRDVANMGFGQNVSVTDINLLAAISAVVNGGVLMQSHVVERVINPDGSVYQQVNPYPIRRGCSEVTSEKVRWLLGNAVEHGTGNRARISGVAVGGKTGTAQIWDPKQKKWLNEYLVSFLLVAPVDRQPEFVILVTARNPKIGQHGADVAAPVAQRIALYMLKQQGLVSQAAAVD